MADVDDGGSAFPQIDSEYSHDRHEYTGNVYSVGGMTLRDYFAGQALTGAIAQGICYPDTTQMYAIADAMLRARKK